MDLTNKIIFIQKSMNLSDHEFCGRYKIRYSLFKKWKDQIESPTKRDVLVICSEFNLDIDDFINESSSVAINQLKPGEHPCKIIEPTTCNVNVALEDFAREDNSRYEEKD